MDMAMDKTIRGLDDIPIENGKPKAPLKVLVVLVVREAGGRGLTLEEICQRIAEKFEWYSKRATARRTIPWVEGVADLLHESEFPTVPSMDQNGAIRFHIPVGRDHSLNHNGAVQNSFHKFHQLPAELRSLVYYWALKHPTQNGWAVPDSPHHLNIASASNLYLGMGNTCLTTEVDGWRLRSPTMNTMLALLLTNKQTYSEAKGIFYKANNFRFGSISSHGDTTVMNDGLPAMLPFLKGIGLDRMSYLRRIQLLYNPSTASRQAAEAFRLLAECKKLQFFRLYLEEDDLISQHTDSNAIGDLPGLVELSRLRGVSFTFGGVCRKTKSFLTQAGEPRDDREEDE
ncbi:hypothetical protein NA57DRAFT_72068 [Rhizodiscina lignyota]|uniref:Fork-head domain-containing protein n=1 Tax=Rhizodiscina lignyota TaxID=1504668 RepID=A0A9P4INB6_9PEZI|nr:hypothetical protein NA57DRAFT_72068 [Rhizodiscina lignyota]